MNNKNIILIITTLLCNSILFSMETKPDNNLTISLLKTLPADVTKTIIHFAAPQWWYLDQLFPHGSVVQSVCFNSQGKHLATASRNKKACIFDIQTHTQIASFPHDNWVNSACFDSQGKRLVIVSGDCKVRIINIETEREIASFQHNDWVYSACFDSQGKRLATASGDSKARIFDIETRTEIASFPHDRWVYSAYFDNQGKRLATASHDKKARIFNIETSREIASFKHNNYVNSTCFDTQGKHLATACYDGKARIFDIETSSEIAFFTHDNVVNSACFDNKGKRLATTSGHDAHIFIHYDNYTLEQLLLKKTLLSWLLIEKPNKQIDTLKKLFSDMTLKYAISHEELINVWATFPKNMQDAIWRTLLSKIQKYGKIMRLESHMY